MLSLKSLKRPGVRAAVHNLGWLIVERGVRLVFGVFVGFWVARYLGPEEFGSLSYALALIAIGVAVAECGVGNIVRRDIVARPDHAGAVLAAAWKLRVITGAVCYVLVLIWVGWGEAGSKERVLLAMLGLLLFQPALTISDLWLQARLEAKVATMAQAGALFVGAGLRVGLVLTRSPLWTFASAAVLEAAVAVLLLKYFARARGQPRLEIRMGEPIDRLWRDSWPLLVSGLTVMLYIRLDVVMVRQMLGEAAAGTYSAAVRISELWFFLPGAVMASLLPAMLRARSAGKDSYRLATQRSLDANAGVAYALAVPTVLLAPWLVRLAYGAEFGASSPVLVVHGWTLLFVALGVVRGQYCINEGLTKLHLIATAGGAGLNVALNFLLIPRMGAVGAAWATLAAQATAAWFSSFLFGATRDCAWMQTRAMLIPFRWFDYVRNSR